MATVRHLGLLPFCIRPAGTYSNDSLMEVSQAFALSLWWRVKKWNVDSASLTIIPDDDPPNEVTMPTGEMSLELPLEGLALETNLVCPYTRQFGVGPGGPNPENVGIFLRIFPTAQQGGDDLISMKVDLTAQGGTTQWFIGNGGGVENEIGTCTLTSAVGSKEFALGSTFNGTASVEISAVEYWPYDPNDGGGPIYDSTTGAQLRGFPS